MNEEIRMADLIIERGKLSDKYENLFPEYEEKIFLYPDWWFELDEYEFQIDMLKKAIEQKKKLNDLEEIQNISYRSNMNVLYGDYMDNLKKK